MATRTDKLIFYPWKCILLISAQNYVIFFAMYSICSYLPQFMNELTKDPDSVGFDVGIAYAIFYTSECIGSGMISILVNYFGAKKCLVVFELALSISFDIYGLSASKTWLFTSIAIVGFFTGVMVCLKILMKDICDDDNEEQIVSWCFGGPCMIGMALGPPLAGVISLPAIQYPRIFDKTGIFGRFPNLLVNSIFSVLTAILSILTCLILPNDLPDYIQAEKAKNQDNFSERGFYHQIHNVAVADSQTSESDADSQTSESDSVLTHVSCRFIGSTVEVQNSTIEAQNSTVHAILVNHIFRNPSALASIALFTLCLGLIDAYQVLLSLWLETKMELGGRDFSANEVSIVMAVSGVILIVLNYTFLHRLHRWIKLKTLFSLSILLSIPLLCCLPLVSNITKKITFYILCSLFHSLLMIFFTIIINTIQIFTQKCAPAESLPFIFAISNVTSYLASALFTFMLSGVFAQSLTDVTKPHQFPLDYRLAFYISAFLILLSHTPLPFVRVDVP